MEPFVGEIKMFAGNFAPLGWATCDGQLLSIAENSTLFQLLGTTYGGDGKITFGLPDLRGRVPVHIGSNRPMGEAGGTETVSLTAVNLPQHGHVAQCGVSRDDAEPGWKLLGSRSRRKCGALCGRSRQHHDGRLSHRRSGRQPAA